MHRQRLCRRGSTPLSLPPAAETHARRLPWCTVNTWCAVRGRAETCVPARTAHCHADAAHAPPARTGVFDNNSQWRAADNMHSAMSFATASAAVSCAWLLHASGAAFSHVESTRVMPTPSCQMDLRQPRHNTKQRLFLARGISKMPFRSANTMPMALHATRRIYPYHTARLGNTTQVPWITQGTRHPRIPMGL